MTTLRTILVALGAAACLFAFAALSEVPGGAVTRAMAGVAMGAFVTSLVYGEATFASVALGAISPLALTAMDRTSLGVAAAAMCLLWLTPRFVLADTGKRLAILGTASLVAAGVAGSIFAAYCEAPLAAHVASCIFAGSCLSLVGVVVPVSTTTAHALRTSAAVIEGPIRDVLLGAARVHESTRWQPRASATRREWRTLVRLSDQRALLEHATGAAEQRRSIDQRIEAVAKDLAPAPDAIAPPTGLEGAASSGEPSSDEAGSLGELDIRIEEHAIEEHAPETGETRSVPPSDV